MKYSIIAASCLLSTLSMASAQAETTVLFDVAEQCRAFNTSQGTRYINPCTLPDKEFTFTVNPASESNNFNQENLIVSFYCESLRPFTFDYQITQGNDILHDSNIAPSADKDDASSNFSLVESDKAYTFKLTALNSSSGFQAIKPGCKVEVTTLSSIIDNDVPVTLNAKINLAIWQSTERVLEKKYSILFKERLESSQQNLAAILSVLRETAPQSTNELASLVDEISDLFDDCSSTYCRTSVKETVETINNNSRESLLSIRDELSALIDNVDEDEQQDNQDYIKWIELKSQIEEQLAL